MNRRNDTASTESLRRLLPETRAPVPAIPGRLAREDYEYVREGTLSGRRKTRHRPSLILRK